MERKTLLPSSKLFWCGLATVAMAACSRSSPVAGESSHQDPPAPKAAIACTARRGPPGTETGYTCPSAETAARCLAGDVLGCAPKSRARGAVAPGGKCVHPIDALSVGFELGDDCAPHAGTTSPSSPKGSLCVMEAGPGAYCTHSCESDGDCADLHRDGFAGRCSAGMCLLDQR
jgi:hypothetical protein